MNKADELGVLIEAGARDWQIFQRSGDDTATIDLSGRWTTPQPHKRATVVVRLVRESDGEPVSRDVQWVRATTRASRKGGAKKTGTWKVSLTAPAGGLYRLESALQIDGGPVEWGQRGDMVHHLGVGDIWVIAGQSNSEGHGKAPAPDAPELGVHVFRAKGCWDLASHPLNDSTGTRYLPNRLGSNPSHSPWLTFGKVLQAELGVPIGLIPAALGGSPLSAWTREVDGVLFDNMLRYVDDACGPGNRRVRGVVWYQGESDVGEEPRQVYRSRFRAFVKDLRASLGDRQLPVITTQLNRWVGGSDAVTDAGWESIRESQRQLAASLRHVFLLSTLDLGLSDGIHTDSLGNVAIGQRAASAALGGVFGRDVKFRHPTCVQARKLSARRVELVFEEVDERLLYDGNIAAQAPFAVRDREGDVPVASWSFPGAERIDLRLARPLVGHAVVVGAPTAYPPTVVPTDVSGYRPMLGFTQKIED